MAKQRTVQGQVPRARPAPRGVRPADPAPVDRRAAEVVALLRARADPRVRESMPRYGIATDKAFGMAMGAMMRLAKELREADGDRCHPLALALWEAGWYEARTVAVMIADPARLTAAQMDRWAKDFDNWAICDTACFKLFDRVDADLAFRKVDQWAAREPEFVRRAAFALLASMALHQKTLSDQPFERRLPLIERWAEDERNFVKKGVSWALRSIGWRSPLLKRAATGLARRLAESEMPAARWVGRDALRDLARPSRTKAAEPG